MLKIFLLPLSTCLLVNEIRFSSWPLLRISVLPEARLEAFLIHLSREVLPIDPINPSVQQLNERPVLLKQMKLIKDACFSNASRNHSLFAPSAFYCYPPPPPASPSWCFSSAWAWTANPFLCIRTSCSLQASAQPTGHQADPPLKVSCRFLVTVFHSQGWNLLFHACKSYMTEIHERWLSRSKLKLQRFIQVNSWLAPVQRISKMLYGHKPHPVFVLVDSIHPHRIKERMSGKSNCNEHIVKCWRCSAEYKIVFFSSNTQIPLFSWKVLYINF